MTALIARPVSKGSAVRCTDNPAMVAAAPPPPDNARYGADPRPRRRAFALAIVLHVLVGLLLIFQKQQQFVKMGETGLKAFSLEAPAAKGSEQDKSEQKVEAKQEVKQSQAVTPPAEVAPPPPVEPPVVTDFQKPNFIILSTQDYAASNIGKQASLRQPSSGQQAGNATAGPGSGPGGATLYPADWYREPTDTELGGYLRADMPRTGWGMIACKTIARYRVDECYVLGESPRGSGFGRSVLNAAWQFQVMPPRVNGKSQVGTWVSIRISYTEGGAKAGPG